ncbi:MAG TPA: NADH-quinone oxidoreductase subunit C [Actinomycetota bacterium]|nr:NADH-quinone oxidoreductase subunit C [Actinomycetota bacterium]
MISAAELAERVRPRLPDVVVARDEVTAVVDRDDLLGMLAWLRSDPELAFDLLASVTATDRPDRTPRYWVVYELSSTSFHHRLRLKIGVAADDPRLPSAVGLYPTADWHERETFDFYGVVFEGHPNLRRIMLPDGWEGHPLRKTEELGGVNTRYRGASIPPVDRRASP